MNKILISIFFGRYLLQWRKDQTDSLYFRLSLSMRINAFWNWQYPIRFFVKTYDPLLDQFHWNLGCSNFGDDRSLQMWDLRNSSYPFKEFAGHDKGITYTAWFLLALQRRDIAKRGQILQNRLCRMSSVLLYIARQWGGGAYGSHDAWRLYVGCWWQNLANAMMPNL